MGRSGLKVAQERNNYLRVAICVFFTGGILRQQGANSKQ